MTVSCCNCHNDGCRSKNICKNGYKAEVTKIMSLEQNSFHNDGNEMEFQSETDEICRPRRAVLCRKFCGWCWWLDCREWSRVDYRSRARHADPDSCNTYSSRRRRTWINNRPTWWMRPQYFRSAIREKLLQTEYRVPWHAILQFEDFTNFQSYNINEYWRIRVGIRLCPTLTHTDGNLRICSIFLWFQAYDHRTH